EQDDVVKLVGTLEERASVVDVDADAAVVVRMARMKRLAELLEPRVDLDRIDVLDSLGQGDCDVASRAGPYDQYVFRRLFGRAVRVRQEVEVFLAAALLRSAHVLVRDAVDADAIAVDLDLVIRRPE